MNYTTTPLPGSEMQIAFTVPADTIRTHYAKSLKDAVAHFSMDGFRKGAVPEKIVLQKIGSLAIWEDATREAIPALYIQILTESKIPAIGRPHFSITKIADGSDADVVVTTAVVPSFETPDYTAIAKQVYSEAKHDPITDEDVASALLDLRRMRVKQDTKTPDESATEGPTTEIPESDLPELTAEYLAGFGTDITTVEILTSKLRHNLEHESIHQFEDKKRAELITKLLEATTIDAPKLLVEHEIDMMLRQYEHDLTMSGVSFDDYLKFTSKTRESMRDEVRVAAARRAQTQLLLEKLLEETGIIADPAKVAAEMTHLREHYKDNAEFNAEHAQSYLEQIYGNQALFAHLESIGGFKAHDHEAWHNHS